MTLLFDGRKTAAHSIVLAQTTVGSGLPSVTDVADPFGILPGTVMRLRTYEDTYEGSPGPPGKCRAQAEGPYDISIGSEFIQAVCLSMPGSLPNVISGSWAGGASVYGPPYDGASNAGIRFLSTGSVAMQNDTGSVTYWTRPYPRSSWLMLIRKMRFATAANGGYQTVWAGPPDGALTQIWNGPIDNVTGANNGGNNNTRIANYHQRGAFGYMTGITDIYWAGHSRWTADTPLATITEWLTGGSQPLPVAPKNLRATVTFQES